MPSSSSSSSSRDEVIRFADELLDAAAFDDYCHNGLQVPGAAEVTKVVTGVSANRELISRAAESGADLLIAHHGLFWSKAPLTLSTAMAERLRLALSAGMNLAGYHLPLDAHPEIGNNALLLDRLGLERHGAFARAGGREIGLVGSSATPLTAAELCRRVTDLLDREPLLLGAGPAVIRTVGILSGGGAPYLGEAIGLGLDALITGEPSEQVSAEAREGGIHFLAAGHHATERFGIAALGARIAERFGVEHEFVDVPNPV